MHPKILSITYGTSRGRDTYGYNLVTLREHGQKKASTCGGGYDMRGTVLGDYIEKEFAAELCAINPETMPENFDWVADELACICYECTNKNYINSLDDDGKISPTKYKPVLARKEAWDSPLPICPHCGEPMERERGAGERVNRGRYYYGLEFYDNNGKRSRVPTATHTRPSIDGACGVESVRRIAEAIGLDIRIQDMGKKAECVVITKKEQNTL